LHGEITKISHDAGWCRSSILHCSNEAFWLAVDILNKPERFCGHDRIEKQALFFFLNFNFLLFF